MSKYGAENAFYAGLSGTPRHPLKINSLIIKHLQNEDLAQKS